MGRLGYLGQNYFHQDWDLWGPTPTNVLERFRRQETESLVEATRDEVASILSSHPDGEALEALWDGTGAAWDPVLARWGTYREWFEEIRRVLS
ncbi:contact-dependent growth inhibition system immunity protein [Luteimicrobium subarcticum]|uniref:CdiI immunity protein domain-containing protein n=1 Tax=Luteimicrobium subarcticum TaxID=620910 RepID=A0A2M8W3M7_9MICO|nr:contact-dependent growth inhibition system immunity protein [Luteimicrobium subarcticum]PJI85528.1 hypothetical protein CLV34_3045 [Luteimicrobium subarcticum]